MSRDRNHHFTFFLAGVGIGAALAVILAPLAGEETRKYIAGRVEESKQYLVGKGKQVRRQAEELAERGRELLTNGRERFAAAVEAGKQTYYTSLER